LVVGHLLFLHRSPLNMIVSSYINSHIENLTFVSSTGITLHITHALHHPTQEQHKPENFKNELIVQKVGSRGHYLFLHGSPLTLTNYINIDIR